jgi:peptide chain release factor 2
LEKYEINKYLEKFHNSVNDLNLALDSVSLEKKLKELNELILEPSFWDDSKKSNKVIAELNVVKEKVNTISEVNKGYDDIKELYEMYTLDESEEMKELLEEEILNFNTLIEETTIKVILNGEYDDNDVILEIHPGAGGTESMDWADMLFRMYQRYCQKHNFKFKVIDYLAGEEAGIKSVTITISGKNAYGMLKGERGVHRLVRISPFDTNKRRHTSFASVDISPVIKDMAEVKINEADLKIDTFCSSGPGGQGVNTTYSAVRITHLPTGVISTSQDGRSQHDNKEKALFILKSRILEKLQSEKNKEAGNLRSSMIGTAERSEKIRTYNYPQNRITDHRLGISWNKLNFIISGDLEELCQKLIDYEVEKRIGS